MKRNIISEHFVAAVLLIDIRNPIFSKKCQSLFRYIPDRFKFNESSGKETLTDVVIKNIIAASPQRGSVDDKFLIALQAGNAVSILKSEVINYRKEVEVALSNNRSEELMRQYDRAIKVRSDFKNHCVLSHLYETENRFLPLP